ncbi:MAG: MFS transporter [Rhodobacteraceae bacterium]|nr:MFS transporter [Paracoccaceae bacterium]
MSATRQGLVALSLTMLLPSLGTSIANVALPDIARAFGAPMSGVQWIVIAYLLAVTALIVTAGRLGDLYGRARLLQVGTLVFGAAAAGASVASGLGWLIALRGAQGAGAAVMMALTMAAVGDLVPRERTGRAMGLLATVSAVGTALGPSLGGVLVARWGWPSVFVASATAAGIALVALRAFVPHGAQIRGRAVLDLPGMALLSAALGLGALAASRGAGQTLPLVAAALALLGAFVVVERRVAAPLVDLSTFTGRDLWPGLAQMALVSMIVMATLVVGPFYLSAGPGLSPAATGLVMSVGPGVVALAGVPAGRLVDRYGAPRVGTAGLAAMLAGTLAMLQLPVVLGGGGYAASLALVTGGYGVFQASNATAILAPVAPDRRGVVSGLLALARNVGLIAGASLMGAVYATGFAGLPALDWPAGADSGLRMVFAVAGVSVLAALALGVRRT